MAAEAATTIHQLNSGAPTGAEPLSEADDHLRVIKTAVKGSFPAFGVGTDSGIVTLGADEINATSTVPGLVDSLFPIGSIYLAAVATNPATLLGHGTWTAIGQGRFLAGVGTGTDSLAAQKVIAAGNTGGTYNHTLTVAQTPAHSHDLYVRSDAGNSNNIEGFDRQPDGAIAGEGDGIHTHESTNQQGDLLATMTGGGESHENTPPAFGIYVWQRTA